MRAPDVETDADLVARARERDQAAFRTLVARHEPAVAATVIGMLGPGDEADDVGQETFIRFYRALDDYRGDASVRTYLTRIAANLSLNALRARKRTSRRDAGPGSERTVPPELVRDARVDADRRDTIARVRGAIAGLAPDHRAVVVLRMIAGHSTRETATILGVPEGTVMSRLKRAMDRLEVELRPWMEDG